MNESRNSNENIKLIYNNNLIITWADFEREFQIVIAIVMVMELFGCGAQFSLYIVQNYTAYK